MHDADISSSAFLYPEFSVPATAEYNKNHHFALSNPAPGDFARRRSEVRQDAITLPQRHPNQVNNALCFSCILPWRTDVRLPHNEPRSQQPFMPLKNPC